MRKIEKLLRRAAFWLFYRLGVQMPQRVPVKYRADVRGQNGRH